MKKGFTLVEVVAVIMLIGIISVIIVPNVFEMSENSAKIGRERLEDQVKAAAYSYINDYPDIKYEIKNKNGSSGKITFKKLVDRGYLSSDNLINPEDKKEINLTTSTVTVTYDINTSEYLYTIDIKVK